MCSIGSLLSFHPIDQWMENVASDFGLGSGFCRVLQFPQLASEDLIMLWQIK